METISREKIQEEISRIISEIIEEDYVLLEEEKLLIDDAGLDSMGFLELAIQIQRSFGTNIMSDEWKKIFTIRDLIETILNKKNENEGI